MVDIKLMGFKEDVEVFVGDLNVKSAHVIKGDPQEIPFVDVVNNFMGTAIERAVVFNLEQAFLILSNVKVGLVLCVNNGKSRWVTDCESAKIFYEDN